MTSKKTTKMIDFIENFRKILTFFTIIYVFLRIFFEKRPLLFYKRKKNYNFSENFRKFSQKKEIYENFSMSHLIGKEQQKELDAQLGTKELYTFSTRTFTSKF